MGGIYKLTYFNLRGICEPIRFIFAYAGVPFEDIYIDRTTWPEVQKTFKWQQLPFLEFNGKVLTQTVAIQNFLSEQFGLSKGVGALEQARHDEIVQAVNDLRLHIFPFLIAKMVQNDPVKATELKDSLLSDKVPLFLKNINDILCELREETNDRNTEFILGGSKPSIADFQVAHFTDLWESLFEEEALLEKYPEMKNVQKAVFDIPQIQQYTKSRPNFPF